MRTLYERVGGPAAVATLVDALYDRLSQDPRVLHHFDPERLESLKDGQRRWFRSVLGDPETPDRPSLAAAHADVDITDDDVTVVLGHLAESLTEAGVDDELRETVVALVARLWLTRSL